MSKSQISDRDIERFFSRQLPEDEVLAELMPRLHEWHARHVRNPSDDQVKVFAVEASQIALASRPEQTTTAAATRARSGRRLLSRLSYQLGVGLAALVLVSGMTGVAVASNEAAPGDALYGVDRALEAIGINNGGAAERIGEAQVLLDRGQTAAAVDHAIEAVESAGEGKETAAEALRAAALRLQTAEKGENAQAVLTQVAWMLDQMAQSDLTGKDFGQQVSSWAQSINPNKPDPNGTPGPLDGEDPTPIPGNQGNGQGQGQGGGQGQGQGGGQGQGQGGGQGQGQGGGQGNGKGRP